MDVNAIAAQEDVLAAAPLPLARDVDGSKTTAEVLRLARAGGKESTAELLTELQRQLVEAERWRAETKRMASQLRKAHDEVGNGRTAEMPQSRFAVAPRWCALCARAAQVSKRSGDMQVMRAQNVTWSNDNRLRREQAAKAKAEAEELRAANAAVVSQVRSP